VKSQNHPDHQIKGGSGTLELKYQEFRGQEDKGLAQGHSEGSRGKRKMKELVSDRSLSRFQ
jgi:hypothetical protein